MPIYIRIVSMHEDTEIGTSYSKSTFNDDIRLILNDHCIVRFLSSKIALPISQLKNIKFDYVFGHNFDKHRFIDIVIDLNERYYSVQKKALETFVCNYLHKCNIYVSRI